MSNSGAKPPARIDALDRRAVERVLARAAELQATRGSGPDTSELISETQLVEIAFEAGLDSAYVRQALAEERTHLPEPTERDRISRAFGAARVVGGRTVEGTATDVLAALDRWMQREECMRLQRRFPERMVWEPRSDLWGRMRRLVGMGGHSYELANTDTVSATAVDIGGGRTLVALEADISGRRANTLRAAAAIAGVGVALAAMLVLFLDVFPIAAAVPAIAASAVAWLLGRTHRRRATKTQLALEQTLDKLEYGEARASRSIANAISAATRPLLR